MKTKALANGSVITTLPALGADRGTGANNNAASMRTWKVTGACDKENKAAGVQNRNLLARLEKVGGVANEGDELVPKANVKVAKNASGMLCALTNAIGESPDIVLLDEA